MLISTSISRTAGQLEIGHTFFAKLAGTLATFDLIAVDLVFGVVAPAGHQACDRKGNKKIP